MRLDIERSDEAERDLHEIWIYIAQDNEQAADQFLQRILALLKTLSAHPDIGKARPELGQEVRSLVVSSNFALYYARTDRALRLLRVIRSSREITPDMFEN